MTTVTLTNPLAPAQRTAAKVAGFVYLVTIVTAAFSEFYARGQLATSEWIFRLGAVGDLITSAGVVMLVVALYVVLKPINRNVALLAAFWRLAESSIFAVITLTDFLALRLLSGAEYLRAFDTKQLHALARLFSGVHSDGYLIGLVFFVGRPRSRICGSSRVTSLGSRLGNPFVAVGGNRHVGHHGVSRFSGLRDTDLLCADLYLRSHSWHLAAC